RTAVRDQGATVRDLGRSHRLVTDRQYRALLLRDHARCTHPGCTNTRGLEAHHIRHWIHGGRTHLANLVLLCPRHHHTHHDGQFRIDALGQGRFRFTRSDGTDLPHHINPADHITTDTPIEADHPHVAGNAATTRWDGPRLDSHYAVAVLAQRRDQARQLAG
ncbi:MAG TPA: HNH endonuclease signature motif containing protein, partial [Jatrophihabitantaceae bacterium]